MLALFKIFFIDHFKKWFQGNTRIIYWKKKRYMKILLLTKENSDA